LTPRGTKTHRRCNTSETQESINGSGKISEKRLTSMMYDGDEEIKK